MAQKLAFFLLYFLVKIATLGNVFLSTQKGACMDEWWMGLIESELLKKFFEFVYLWKYMNSLFKRNCILPFCEKEKKIWIKNSLHFLDAYFFSFNLHNLQLSTIYFNLHYII